MAKISAFTTPPPRPGVQIFPLPKARAIRLEWERLKSVTEGFVAECEAGDFQTLRKVVAQTLRPVAALSSVA